MTMDTRSHVSPGVGSRMKGILLDTTLASVLVVAGLIFQSRWSPRFVEMGPDSGLFAYGGQRILQGELLYRDVFDTKPPGVFYLDAVALWLGGESVWPIWALSALWSVAVVVSLYLVLRPLTGRLASLAAAACFLVVLHQTAVYQGGNSTELFALLPQVLGLGATIRYLDKRRMSAVYLAGLATALAFLFKPTCIALGVCGFALVLGRGLWERQARLALKVLFIWMTGFLLPLLLVAVYWSVRGGLTDMANALFVYGSAYVHGGLSARSLYATFRTLTESAPMANLTMLAAAGMLLLAWDLRRASRQRSSASGATQGVPNFAAFGIKNPADHVFLVALGGIPLEWSLAALSGRNYGHYFITPLPAMATMAAFALHRAWSAWQENEVGSPWRLAFAGLATALLAVGLLLGIVPAMPDAYQWNLTLEAPYGGEARVDPLVKYVTDLTSAGDTVLVWANKPGVNFITVRPAPSRYLFPTQVLLDDGRAAARLYELLAAVKRNPPMLVAEEVVSGEGIPPILSTQAGGCRPCSPDTLEAWARLREYMIFNYSGAENVGDWTVFHRLDAPEAQ